MTSADTVTHEVMRLRAENRRLREALKPLADLAVAIDGNPSCVDRKRSSDSTIWQANVMQRGPFDLTMAHARAARLALVDGGGDGRNQDDRR